MWKSGEAAERTSIYAPNIRAKRCRPQCPVEPSPLPARATPHRRNARPSIASREDRRPPEEATSSRPICRSIGNPPRANAPRGDASSRRYFPRHFPKEKKTPIPPRTDHRVPHLSRTGMPSTRSTPSKFGSRTLVTVTSPPPPPPPAAAPSTRNSTSTRQNIIL